MATSSTMCAPSSGQMMFVFPAMMATTSPRKSAAIAAPAKERLIANHTSAIAATAMAVPIATSGHGAAVALIAQIISTTCDANMAPSISLSRRT